MWLGSAGCRGINRSCHNPQTAWGRKKSVIDRWEMRKNRLLAQHHQAVRRVSDAQVVCNARGWNVCRQAHRMNAAAGRGWTWSTQIGQSRVEIRSNDKSDTWGIAGGYNLWYVVRWRMCAHAALSIGFAMSSVFLEWEDLATAKTSMWTNKHLGWNTCVSPA